MVDIPGAFLQANIDEDVWMALDGTLAELMCKVSPKLYSKYVTTNKKGRKILYVKLDKAIYGLLKSALQFYRRLSEDLTKMGFKINYYNPCLANNFIRGKEMTITWHVDDLKISHQDPKQVTKIIKQLKTLYGKHRKLTVLRGKRHKYLGMTLDYTKKGKVKVNMVKYVHDTWTMFPEELDGKVATPAAEHLFEVREDAPALEEGRRQTFHTIVSRSLFMGKKARPDVQPTVAFLCTRVKEADNDDWKKLRRLMLFLKQTEKDVLTLSANDIRLVKWWVDGSYAVHKDCRSQTGATMSMGQGSILSSSKKQGLNTRSLTETEVVAVDDKLPQILWTKYFLDEQGYNIEHRLQQDNISAQRLEIIGTGSSGKRTKHMRVRYFFIQDRIKVGDVSIDHCGTDEMIADYFTKPLQGRKFEYF